MAQSKHEKKDNKKDDVIEIPLGKFVNKIRDNPWIIASVVLGIAFIVSLFFIGSDGASVSGNAISGTQAGGKLVEFINAQGTGTASFVSAQESGSFYNVIVNYNGQDVPVFVTTDGKYLVTNPIPLSDDVAVPTQTQPTDTNRDNPNVDAGDNPVMGKADAPITIIEFSDFECPFCEKFYTETLPQLKKNYVDTGKAKIIYMDFPLSFHPEAQKAAEAAECFREQKGDAGYYKMHDKLFENQASLSVENSKKWAKELGADSKKFDECLDSGKFESAVQADFSYGQSLGVSGTPSFFINGRFLEGAQPYSAFEQAIEAQLNS